MVQGIRQIRGCVWCCVSDFRKISKHKWQFVCQHNFASKNKFHFILRLFLLSLLLLLLSLWLCDASYHAICMADAGKEDHFPTHRMHAEIAEMVCVQAWCVRVHVFVSNASRHVKCVSIQFSRKFALVYANRRESCVANVRVYLTFCGIYWGNRHTPITHK